MRRQIVAAAVAAASLAVPAAAQAHVSLHPNTVPAGAFVTLNVRVPGEEDGASANKVDMELPPGFISVDTQNVPGWTVKEVTTKLAQPIQTADGPVDQEVSHVIWTGDGSSDGRIDNGSFVQFPLSIAMPDNIAGKSLAFKTLEYYSNGKIARWIGPPSADSPAPTINVTPKGGVIEDVAGDEAGPAAGEVPAATTSSSSGASKGLGIAALIVGAVGVLLGGAALMRSRKS